MSMKQVEDNIDRIQARLIESGTLTSLKDVECRLNQLESRLNKPKKIAKKRVFVWVELPDETKQALVRMAESNDTSVSKLVAKMIKNHLGPEWYPPMQR